MRRRRIRRLNAVDASWLYVDSRNTPMHVGCLALFSIPPNTSPTFLQSLVAHLRAPSRFVSPFNLRLRGGRPGSWVPQWIEDRDIDIDFHLRHHALPMPGGERELGMLISRLHSYPLDFSRPLWECHVIERLAGNRFALYMKMHHSLVDGADGLRMLSRMLSTEPDTESQPPPWAVGVDDEPAQRQRRRRGGPSWHQLVDRTRQQLLQLPLMGRALAKNWAEALVSPDGDAGLPYRAPRSLLNARVSAQRRFATQHYDLERIRAVARETATTTNDVFLCMCASALRRYLDELGVLPDASLTAGMPLAIRMRDDGATVNEESFIIANLHTQLADPLERLAAIRRSTQIAKRRVQSLPRSAVPGHTLALMAPFMLQLITGTSTLTPPMFNLTLSNVPGPEEPLYLNGARLEQIYPVSLLSQGHALNITVVTYADQFNVGYTGCRDTLPHMQRLAVYTGEALDELERRLA